MRELGDRFSLLKYYHQVMSRGRILCDAFQLTTFLVVALCMMRLVLFSFSLLQHMIGHGIVRPGLPFPMPPRLPPNVPLMGPPRMMPPYG